MDSVAALGKEVGTASVTAAVGMAMARQEVEPEADRTVREAAEMVAAVAVMAVAMLAMVHWAALTVTVQVVKGQAVEAMV